MRPGEVLHTRWLVKGVPRHIPTGSAVTVREVHYYTKTGKPTKNPKSAARTRVGVEYMGNVYWLNPEDFEGVAENPTKDLPQKKLRGVAHAAAKQYGDVKSLRFLETRGGDARFLVKTTTGDVYVSVSVISPYRVISAEPVEFKPGRGWIPRDNPNFPPYSRQLKVGDRATARSNPQPWARVFG